MKKEANWNHPLINYSPTLMMMYCSPLPTCQLLSSGFGSAHHRRPDPGDGEPRERHRFRHGGGGGAQAQTRRHGARAHLRALLPLRCAHHPSRRHLVLRGRQHCNYSRRHACTLSLKLVTFSQDVANPPFWFVRYVIQSLFILLEKKTSFTYSKAFL